MKNILVVCMGNICRSPMAEALLRHYLLHKPQLKISSAGITAMVGKPAVDHAREVMLEKKSIDISAHRGRQINKEILHAADLIFVMEQDQLKQIEFQYPSICGRVHRLGKFKSFDIPDPYRRPKQVFEHTLQLIEDAILEWQRRLWK